MSTKRGNASSRSRSHPYASSVVVSGKRPLRAEHAQEPGFETNDAARIDARGFEGRGGKLEIGIFAERRRYSSASVRASPMRGFPGFSRSSRRRTAQQVEPPGLGDEFGAERHRHASQPDARRPAHDFAALDRADDGLGEMVDRDVFGEEAVEDRAEEKRAGAFERLFFESDGDLEAARRRCAFRLPQPPHDRPRADAAHAADLAVGRAVGEVGEQNERLAQRLARRPSRGRARPR